MLWPGHSGAVRCLLPADSWFKPATSDAPTEGHDQPQSAALPGRTWSPSHCASEGRYVATRWVFSGGDDATVRLFDVLTCQCVFVYHTACGMPVTSLALLADEVDRPARLLVCCDGATAVECCDARTGRPLRPLETRHPSTVTTVAVLHSFAYVGCSDGTVLELHVQSDGTGRNQDVVATHMRSFQGSSSTAPVTDLHVHMVWSNGAPPPQVTQALQARDRLSNTKSPGLLERLRRGASFGSDAPQSSPRSLGSFRGSSRRVGIASIDGDGSVGSTRKLDTVDLEMGAPLSVDDIEDASDEQLEADQREAAEIAANVRAGGDAALLYAATEGGTVWAVDLGTGIWLPSRFRARAPLVCIGIAPASVESPSRRAATATSPVPAAHPNLVCGSGDGSVRFLDSRTGRQAMVVHSGQNPLRAFTRVGNYLMLAGGAGHRRSDSSGDDSPNSGSRVTVMNITTTNRLPGYNCGHIGAVNALAVTEGTVLWSAGDDGAVVATELNGGRSICKLANDPVADIGGLIATFIVLLQLVAFVLSVAAWPGGEAFRWLTLAFMPTEGAQWGISVFVAAGLVAASAVAACGGSARRFRRRAIKAQQAANAAPWFKDLHVEAGGDEETANKPVKPLDGGYGARRARVRASREALERKAKMLHVLSATIRIAPWLVGTVLYFGVTLVLLSPLFCRESASGPVVAVAPDCDCFGSLHVATLCLSIPALVVFASLGLRLARTGGDVLRVGRRSRADTVVCGRTCSSRGLRQAWNLLSWSRDGGPLTASTMSRSSTTWDTLLCAVRVVFAYGYLLHAATGTDDGEPWPDGMTLSFVGCAALFCILLWTLPFLNARVGALVAGAVLSVATIAFVGSVGGTSILVAVADLVGLREPTPTESTLDSTTASSLAAIAVSPALLIGCCVYASTRSLYARCCR